MHQFPSLRSPATRVGGRAPAALAASLAAAALIALAAPATGNAIFFSSAGGEPAVTNTSTNSHFFDYQPGGFTTYYAVTVYRPSAFNRGTIGPYTANGQFSQTETGLADGTLVGTYPLEYRDGIPYPCSGPQCSSSTVIDLNQPQLTVFASGTANYTNNPQIPMHIDYSDALSHPWFAGGNNAAVYVCQRRDRACNNADLHSYTPVCSVVNGTRFSSPGNAKTNSFDCMYDFTTQPDGPVYLCAVAADQSIPDPDPNANESASIFPTHVNQFQQNPGDPWNAGDANLSNSSCGSVILDRAPPALGAAASDTTPGTGDLVTFSASGTDGVSGIAGPYTWNFGDNTPSRQGANITHTFSDAGTYRVELAAADGAGNPGATSVDVVVTAGGGGGGGGGEGEIVTKPPKTPEGGAQKANLGGLQVIAPKKHKLDRKPKPILLALVASEPGAVQAGLAKGPKVVSEGAGVLATAGTYGFKMTLPKKLRPGKYQLRITFVPDGATSGATKTLPIKLTSGKKKGRSIKTGPAESRGPVNVDAGPDLAANYGG